MTTIALRRGLICLPRRPGATCVLAHELGALVHGTHEVPVLFVSPNIVGGYHLVGHFILGVAEGGLDSLDGQDLVAPVHAAHVPKECENVQLSVGIEDQQHSESSSRQNVLAVKHSVQEYIRLVS